MVVGEAEGEAEQEGQEEVGGTTVTKTIRMVTIPRPREVPVHEDEGEAEGQERLLRRREVEVGVLQRAREGRGEEERRLRRNESATIRTRVSFRSLLRAALLELIHSDFDRKQGTETTARPHRTASVNFLQLRGQSPRRERTKAVRSGRARREGTKGVASLNGKTRTAEVVEVEEQLEAGAGLSQRSALPRVLLRSGWARFFTVVCRD
jgi:hypothetical protein